MIRFLSIRHLALIESVDIEFDSGLNVLTGETGAGKSILIEAVGLLLGGRSTTDIIRTGSDVASVQAEFETADGRQVLVRRELSVQGRSRSFVDDQLVTTAGLKAATADLIDLHGQHEYQRLLQPGSQLALLDEFGGWTDLLTDVSGAYANYQQFSELERRAIAEERTRDDQTDLLTYQLGEISKVDPQSGEDETLAARRRRLVESDRVRRLAVDISEALYDSDGSVSSTLSGVWKRLDELAAYDPDLRASLELKSTVDASLAEIGRAVRPHTMEPDADDLGVEEVEERLASLERLKRKYGPSLDDVLARAASMRGDLNRLSGLTEQAAEFGRLRATARQQYLSGAATLSERRREAAQKLCRAVERELAALAMERTRCAFAWREAEGESHWSPAGIDVGELHISPNLGEDLRPISKIASGGELSRLMLALRTVTLGRQRPSTLIFDEVDAGIGGRTADAVGTRLANLAKGSQVLCVTHLPQVAACGNAHFRVEKSSALGRTVTRVARLDRQERVEEIGRMMAGGAANASVLQGAAEMLAARHTEAKAKGERAKVEKAKGKGL
ncbi:MAG: DNA repair protein RecN [Vicinamibacterales bacterium]